MENEPVSVSTTESKTISITPETLQNIVTAAVRDALEQVVDRDSRSDVDDTKDTKRDKKKNRTLVLRGPFGGRVKVKAPRNWFGFKFGGK